MTLVLNEFRILLRSTEPFSNYSQDTTSVTLEIRSLNLILKVSNRSYRFNLEFQIKVPNESSGSNIGNFSIVKDEWDTKR